MEQENLVGEEAGGLKTLGWMTMRVNLLSLTDDTIRFVIEGIDIAFANAIRRTIINEVPCMAIDDLFIFDNSSVVSDEILANRIGFMPLKTDLSKYKLPEDCDCNSELGCEKCRVVLALDVETKDEIVTVLSGDFVSDDPDIVPVSPDIPLTKLASGQAVRLEAYARLGIGKTHSKWQPVSSSIYQHLGVLKIDDKRCDICGKCAETCPTKILEIKEKRLEIVDIYNCILCEECIKACPLEPSAITLGYAPDSFIFTVESTGCMPPETIVTEAVKILINKVGEFTTKIEKDDLHDEIESFQVDEEQGRRLYSVGGDVDDDEDDDDDVAEDIQE